MSRTRSFDRDAALDTAMRLFWERGFDNTSMSELTAAMGIAPPSLYAAFGSKRELFDEAAERYQNDPGGFSVLALDEPTTRGAIARLLHDAAIEYTKSGQPRGCMILSEPLLGAHRKRSRATLLDRINQGVTSGELPPDIDVGALADYVSVVLAGMSARSRDGATRRELIGVAEAAMAAWPSGRDAAT
jgi:AcrR family transcriptional regulator